MICTVRKKAKSTVSVIDDYEDKLSKAFQDRAENGEQDTWIIPCIEEVNFHSCFKEKNLQTDNAVELLKVIEPYLKKQKILLLVAGIVNIVRTASTIRMDDKRATVTI